VIAKLVAPGSNEPFGFILTTVLGIVGAFVASWSGQVLGWYGPGEGYAAADTEPNLIASPRAYLVGL